MKKLDLVQLSSKPSITTIEKWILNTIQLLTLDLKKANVLVDVPQYIIKSKKKLYEEMLSSNREFMKDNKVPQSIIDNQKYFEQIVSSL